MAAERRSSALHTFGRYALLTFAAAIVILPIYTAVVLSVQPSYRLLQFPKVLIPTTFELDTFRRAWSTAHLGRYMLNSAGISLVIVTAQIVTSILAAYAFAFLRFPFKRVLFIAFLATLMVPGEVTIVANYETMRTFGWLGTYQGLAVPFLATAFGTFLLRQSFLQVPQDLRDAAALDGYGHGGFLVGVAVPLARPAIAALTVFSFLLSWNQYLWPLLITNDDRHRTVQIGLKSLAAANVNELNLIMAGTVIASLPIFALLLVFQRQLVRGLTTGAVKG